MGACLSYDSVLLVDTIAMAVASMFVIACVWVGVIAIVARSLSAVRHSTNGGSIKSPAQRLHSRVGRRMFLWDHCRLRTLRPWQGQSPRRLVGW